MSQWDSLLLVLVVAFVTAAIRFLPFLVFHEKTPKAILYLGRVLPCAIMAMLVIYCLRSVSLATFPHGIPEIIAVLAVVLLHKWKHNTLISIPVGTVIYMLLVQIIG